MLTRRITWPKAPEGLWQAWEGVSKYSLKCNGMGKAGRNRSNDMFSNFERMVVSRCSTKDVGNMIGVRYAGYRLDLEMIFPPLFILGRFHHPP